jgi:hypothetical protein
LERKVTSRKVLQKFGGLITRDAQRKLNERRQKKDATKAKRQQKAQDKIWRAEKKAKYREGVEARELERQRKRKVKLLEKAKQSIPSNLLVPIPDPEKIWLAKQEEMKRELDEQHHQEEEEVTFVTNTIGDPSLQPLGDDYIPFSRDDADTNDTDDSNDADDFNDTDSSLDSGDSELYDSDKDYSWFGRHRGK